LKPIASFIGIYITPAFVILGVSFSMAAANIGLTLNLASMWLIVNKSKMLDLFLQMLTNKGAEYY